MTASLFAYPPRHERRHGPAGYDQYEAYKPWLRDEFLFRCVYCLERETWYPDGAASLSVDHVIPQSEDAALVCEYTNLVYACTRCNSARQNLRLLDPTTSTFGDHIQASADGLLVGVSDEGLDLIDALSLNDNPALSVRRRYATIFALRERYPRDADIEALFLQAFGFPDDLPDLRAKRPPGGNVRAGSEQSCDLARRGRGELPQTY